MKLLLDTNTLSYILKGRRVAVDQLGAAIQRDGTFLLGSMVNYELMRYLKLKGSHRLVRLYKHFVADWHRCNLTFEDGDAAARFWEERHRLGKSISDMGLLLATLARFSLKRLRKLRNCGRDPELDFLTTYRQLSRYHRSLKEKDIYLWA